MQVPGRYDPETRRCVVDKPGLAAETGHWIDSDGDSTVSKAEFARWFERQGEVQTTLSGALSKVRHRPERHD